VVSVMACSRSTMSACMSEWSWFLRDQLHGRLRVYPIESISSPSGPTAPTMVASWPALTSDRRGEQDGGGDSAEERTAAGADEAADIEAATQQAKGRTHATSEELGSLAEGRT